MAVALLLCTITDIHRVHRVFFLVNLAALLVIFVVRVAFTKRVEDLARRNFRLARILTIGLLLLSSLYWGLLSAALLYVPSMRIAEVPMIVSTAAIAGGATNTFASDRILRALFPMFMMVPSIVVLAIDPDNYQHLMLAITSTVYVLYTMTASRVLGRDYLEAKTNGLLLEERSRQLEERSRELEELSTTDALTKLRNRLFFNTHFDIEWRRACRHHHAVAVLLIDLDHFKHVNDHYGHAVGDRCLQSVGSVLRANICRAGDIVARYGGEEFIVFLPNTDPEGAQVVAERLRCAVAAIELVHEGERIPVTCSIGLASYVPAQSDYGYHLINKADEALYEAKRAGRDRVIASVQQWPDVNPTAPSGSVQ
ncbi:MAG: GGDEF domain-containing protein [Nevskia sp.]|nr:GGDEF domain-containing protein [Nevskia sp.]